MFLEPTQWIIIADLSQATREHGRIPLTQSGIGWQTSYFGYQFSWFIILTESPTSEQGRSRTSMVAPPSQTYDVRQNWATNPNPAYHGQPRSNIPGGTRIFDSVIIYLTVHKWCRIYWISWTKRSENSFSRLCSVPHPRMSLNSFNPAGYRQGRMRGLREPLFRKVQGVSPRNIIIFGETGTGKSSLINMLSNSQMAEVSNLAVGCTFQSNPYPIILDDVLT